MKKKPTFRHLNYQDMLLLMPEFASKRIERCDITWHTDPEHVAQAVDIVEGWQKVRGYDLAFDPAYDTETTRRVRAFKPIKNIELGTMHALSVAFKQAGFTDKQMRNYLLNDIDDPRVLARIRGAADLDPIQYIDTDKPVHITFPYRGLRVV